MASFGWAGAPDPEARSLAITFSIPPRRTVRRPRSGPKRLLADAGNAGNRQGSGAAGDVDGTDQVKVKTDRRKRRLRLQTSDREVGNVVEMIRARRGEGTRTEAPERYAARNRR